MTTPTQLREPSFLLLTALADGPKHGYALLTDVERLSRGRLKVRPGSLYGSLDRLADDGLVELAHSELVGGRTRRYYKITDRGVACLADNTRRLRDDVMEATARLRAIGVQA